MKLFNEKNGKWSSKVNFVDENNVILGYDLSQDCCEHAGWFIADAPVGVIMEQKDQNPDLTGYSFDVEYYELRKNTSELDEGGIAIFKITNGIDDKFIHLFNAHNGYYNHGFIFIDKEKTINETWI